MKKNIFSFLVCLLVSGAAYSQVKVSLRVSPALVTNRVTDANESDGYSVTHNGAHLAFIAGPSIDFFLSDNFAIGTGLHYMSTRVGGSIRGNGTDYSFKRNLQYIQTPITFKAYTNEFATNMQLYFQLGTTTSIKIAEKLQSSNVNGQDPESRREIISPIDIGIYAGAGLLLNVGESNAVFAGLYYNRSLINIMNNSDYRLRMHMKADLIGLEAGFRF